MLFASSQEREYIKRHRGIMPIARMVEQEVILRLKDNTFISTWSIHSYNIIAILTIHQ